MDNRILQLINPDPITRINDSWYLHNVELQKLVAKFPEDSKIKNFVDHYTMCGYDHQLYQQAFLQIVTETVHNYPVSFISEKTIKPIVNKRPFIIIGPANSLTQLHNLGFKTFNNFWDESYDNIKSPEDRLLAVFNIIEQVCRLSIVDIQLLCKNMESTLNYNFEFYKNSFMINEIKKFKKACQNNLGNR